jgi:3(or 17)beta-hydroxysteroid dehydrogenase
MLRLAGRIALVTGGAAGLGHVIATRFAAEGARVVISDVQTELGQRAAAATGIMFLEHDVTSEAQWSRAIQSIEATYGPLDVLVNNAGIVGSMERASPESACLDDWRRVFAVNVDGVFLGCRAAIASMRKAGGGSIVNIASIAGLLATPYATAYGATKAAVRQLTKSVAQHCAQERLNIRCNSIHPGVVPTALWQKHAEELARKTGATLDRVIENASQRNPLGSLTTPEDVASACVFLASDEGRHVNGTKLIVDGGVVACSTFRRDEGG